jgi:hypothetical protein
VLKLVEDLGSWSQGFAPFDFAPLAGNSVIFSE